VSKKRTPGTLEQELEDMKKKMRAEIGVDPEGTLQEPPDRDPADPYAEIRESAKLHGTGFTDARMDELPAIEKENREGLHIPLRGIAATSVVHTYTGFRFTEDDSFRTRVSGNPQKSTMIDWQWATVPWYARLTTC
jgi:hypothetical protein